MFLIFRRKHDREKQDENERQVDEIKKALFKNIDNTTKQTKKANSALDTYKHKEDITLNIYLATGGDKRK